MASSWKPKEEEIKDMYRLIEVEQLFPADLNNYLVFILSRSEGKLVEHQARVAHLLEENLKFGFKSMPTANWVFIKLELFHCLEVADLELIKCYIGTIINVLVQLGGVYEWPELVETIVNCLDSNVKNQVTCGMGGVGKMGTFYTREIQDAYLAASSWTAFGKDQVNRLEVLNQTLKGMPIGGTRSRTRTQGRSIHRGGQSTCGGYGPGESQGSKRTRQD